MILLMLAQNLPNRKTASIGRSLSSIPLSNFSALLSSCVLCLLLVFFLTSLPALSAELLVAAAADLVPVEGPLSTAFQKVSGQGLRFALGSSGMLARQIQNGAPYDVYLSANQQYVVELVDSGDLLRDSVQTYALGRLGLWSKDGSIRNLSELANPKLRHIAIANPAHAPYGVAARQALENRKLWQSLQSKIVYGENVRQAFQFAESGNADATITSWTLVFDRGGILLPASWHKPIRQTGGVLKRSQNPDLARRFLDFLTGPEGQAVLGKYGLSPPK
jgi:molybdate transport system substrate-binding protein